MWSVHDLHLASPQREQSPGRRRRRANEALGCVRWLEREKRHPGLALLDLHVVHGVRIDDGSSENQTTQNSAD